MCLSLLLFVVIVDCCRWRRVIFELFIVIFDCCCWRRLPTATTAATAIGSVVRLLDKRIYFELASNESQNARLHKSLVEKVK